MIGFSAGTRNASYVMTIEDTQKTQRPYRYGIILLCCGALINWLGLTEDYGLSIRYLGVSCIICGAILICSAMCCWLHSPSRSQSDSEDENDEPIHIITVQNDRPIIEKPPAYDAVNMEPPTYDDAIKLNPALFFSSSSQVSQNTSSTTTQDCSLPNEKHDTKILKKDSR